jgi:hypothetical protein
MLQRSFQYYGHFTVSRREAAGWAQPETAPTFIRRQMLRFVWGDAQTSAYWSRLFDSMMRVSAESLKRLPAGISAQTLLLRN